MTGMEDTKKPKGHGIGGRVGTLRLVIGLLVFLVVGTIWAGFLSGQIKALEVLSDSMAPTIIRGDRLLVRSFTKGDIERGMLVILTSPDDNGPDLVKRVVGIPGDRVGLKNGIFVVNGEPNGVNGGPPTRYRRGGSGDFTMGEGQYFLLGDNRLESHDSMEFGPVPRDLITGRVILRYAPRSRFGQLDETPRE